jgi:hypothetical protein
MFGQDRADTTNYLGAIPNRESYGRHSVGKRVPNLSNLAVESRIPTREDIGVIIGIGRQVLPA